jgi:glycine/D-amino acid oxidase-like deaminating enzyme
MSSERVDAVIIGAGLAGSATAWALARRGRSAVVLEAFEPGHRRGSSHGSARIFRRAYLDPLYVGLTGQAQRLWRQLADEAGEELVLATGGLDFGPARELLGLLRPRSQVRTAHRRDRRRPGLRESVTGPALHPRGTPRLSPSPSRTDAVLYA